MLIICIFLYKNTKTRITDESYSIHQEKKETTVNKQLSLLIEKNYFLIRWSDC